MHSGFSASIVAPKQQATTDVANKIAPLLKASDVLLLSGDIGSGKTHFARAIIQCRLGNAGLSEDVPSPTYTIVQTYDDGLAEIWHADLYRLNNAQDCLELGLQAAFAEAICLVEWPDRLGDLAPVAALHIAFKPGQSEGVRMIQFSSVSDRWAAVRAAVLSN